ncbi:NAD-dependent epimerase/dehydratase family protein [Nitrosomonas sp. Is37]|uniref:NAD-dependent epimerase/dehydratase family protein n=1 Tax=Nitrosomonas sp. Is37 TaxID=3080535 RepID=UPI00294ABB6D|nr:NAD-dependent epimerase/dehydratase family protein [Nitrosomonas sp. Is37]MDV6345357.1 NAD-dependent epimerase/dehydratase family protein [Nitrosomonas sp. Is37]
MHAPIIITGAAGFIGMHLAQALLARGEQVVGLDNLNDYYDPALKEARLAQLQVDPAFAFEHVDITNQQALTALLVQLRPRRIVHLAAQVGVRHSITHPHAFIDANLMGFLNVLEAARHLQGEGAFEHLVYASSSSVYGTNSKIPFAVEDRVDAPVSLYGASKRANELMALVYARQFRIAATGLRFFTVYGPWGRPDMAAFKFTRAILVGESIDVYNHGQLQRDFTYIDDVVAAVLVVLDRPAPAVEGVPHALYNIGNQQPEPLLRFIEVLAQALGCTPMMNLLPMQAGDMPTTYADTTPLQRDFGWRSTTTIDQGLPRFVAWYRGYYAV